MDELRCAFFFSTMLPAFQMYSCVSPAYEAVVSGRDHHVVVQEDDRAESDLQRVLFAAVRLAVLLLLLLLQLRAQPRVLHHLGHVLDGHLREVDQSALELPAAHVLEAEGIYVRISPERFGEPGLAWRNPFWKPPGAVMRKAPITALADIPALTARIARELKIAPPAQPGLI